ncbi:MAG: polysaccharide biosynthesis protein [Defluviitaleaceae bacterium]|nr:polysaccharide biosynthesis protein [Defluviitaleaceae bacterium]
MSNKKRAGAFVKQAAILASAGVVVRLIGFAYRLPLTALIGDEGNGIYGASYNIYLFFLVISSAGFPTAISKMVSVRIAKGAYYNAHEVFKTCLLLVSGLGLAAAVTLALGANFFAWIINPDDLATYYSILALAPTVFLVAIMAVFRGYFQGMSRTEPTAVSQLVEGIFNAVFTVVLAMMFLGATGDIAMGSAGATAGKGVGAFFGLLTLVFLYFLCSPIIRQRVRNEDNRDVPRESRKEIAREAFSTAFPIIIGVAIFSITNLIDTVMVNSILTGIGWEITEVREAFGQLSGKFMPLTTLPVAVATAIATAAIPSIAGSMSLGNVKEANFKINKAVRITMIFSIPAAVGIGVLGDQILMLLYPTFPGGGILLRVGSISIIFMAISQIATGMLQGCGHMKIPMYAALIGAVVKIILNLILIRIPAINVVGSVISTTACYIVAAGINLYMLMQIMGPKARLNFVAIFVKPLMASCVMALVSFSVYYVFFLALNGVIGVIAANAFSCILAIIAGALVYFVYMIVIKGLDEHDIETFPKGARINKLIKEIKGV